MRKAQCLYFREKHYWSFLHKFFYPFRHPSGAPAAFRHSLRGSGRFSPITDSGSACISFSGVRMAAQKLRWLFVSPFGCPTSSHAFFHPFSDLSGLRAVQVWSSTQAVTSNIVAVFIYIFEVKVISIKL